MNQNRIILHVDLNHYYAQVEEMLQPSLQQCAMAVAGEKERRNGIILAKNDLAKSAGVLTGETIDEAKKNVLGSSFFPPDMIDICISPAKSVSCTLNILIKSSLLESMRPGWIFPSLPPIAQKARLSHRKFKQKSISAMD